MQPLSLDILKTMDVIYKESSKDALYPYPKTVLNILKGNPLSLNAKPFHHHELFGKYKNLKNKTFKDALNLLEAQYIDTIKKHKKVLLVLKPSVHVLLEGEPHLIEKNRDLYNKPFNRLFQHTLHLKAYPDAYFDHTFTKVKDVVGIHSNHFGHLKLSKMDVEVAYESSDEKLFLTYLNEQDYVKSIKTQALLIEYKVGTKTRKYYPDFVIQTIHNHIIVVEIKAINQMTHYLNIRKYEAMKAYCTQHGYGYTMLGYRREGKKRVMYSYEMLKNRVLSNPAIEQVFVDMVVKEGEMSPEMYKAFKRTYTFDTLDIDTMIIRHHFKKASAFKMHVKMK